MPHKDEERKRKRPVKEATDLENYDVAGLQKLYGWADTDYLVGIDEAGRGPALGPMVYCAFGVQVGRHGALDCLGVKDSKVLTEKQRDELFPILTADAQRADGTYSYAVDPISPERISAAMSSRDKTENLNTISHTSAIDMLKQVCQQVAAKGHRVVAVWVDTVGPMDKYRDKIKKHLPELHITVTPKADARFAVVSAASIVAKVTRDTAISGLKSKFMTNVGSGYPGDPMTKQFLANSVHVFHGYNESAVRMRWSTVEKIIQKSCIPVCFQTDEEATTTKVSAKGHQPQTLSVFKEEGLNDDHFVVATTLRLSHVRAHVATKRKRDNAVDDLDSS